jgi:hypothetical protein
MAPRFVRPETTKLDLSDGDWLLVKRRLTHGEHRAAYARMYVWKDGELRADPLHTGIAMVVAYLLDWSLTDEAGKPVVIRDQSADVVDATLRALDHDSFVEIKTAVDAHEEAMLAEREAEKKTRKPALTVAAISPSPSAAAGASTGSVN